MKFFTLIVFVILRLVKNPGATTRNLHRPILFLLVLLFPAMTAVNIHAQEVERDFAERAVFKERGNIEMIGNVLVTCAAEEPDPPDNCVDVRTGFDGTSGNNNNRQMEYVNTDSGAGWPNSSSADLDLPDGATVLYAGLYWGGRAEFDNENRSSLQFRVAGSDTYESVDADSLDTIHTAGGELTRPYLASADVTDLVRDAGNGTYYAGDLTARVDLRSQNLGFYGGWSLIVIYRDDTQPLRYLGLLDGAVHVINGSYDINISGFRTPASGSFNTFTGGLVWEGDQGGDSSSGDQFRLEDEIINNSLNPSDNFWNSSITRLDNRISAKDPDYVNQLGLDIDYMDVSGILDNGAEEATLSFFSGFGSDDDTYYSHALTFAVDLEVVDLSVELDGGPC